MRPLLLHIPGMLSALICRVNSQQPVFESNDETGQYGPGHNSFMQENGKDIMVYHARPYKEIEGNSLYDPNRHTRAQVITWHENGAPNFGVPCKDRNKQAAN